MASDPGYWAGPMAFRYDSHDKQRLQGNLSEEAVRWVMTEVFHFSRSVQPFNALEWARQEYPVGTRVVCTKYHSAGRMGTVVMREHERYGWPEEGRTAWLVSATSVDAAVQWDGGDQATFLNVEWLVKIP